MKLQVVWENSHFIFVDKPSGMLSIPGRQGEKDPRPTVASQLQVRVFPVHRLDLEVSGLLCFAKTTDAHKKANQWFENRKVHKVYEAWSECRSQFNFKLGQDFFWESKILRGKKRAYESEHGKIAQTRAVWMGELKGSYPIQVEVWKLEPITGRSHQLRFELAKHGFPILGDELYGAKASGIIPAESIALRSIEINFKDCRNEAIDLGLPEKVTIPGLETYFSKTKNEIS